MRSNYSAINGFLNNAGIRSQVARDFYKSRKSAGGSRRPRCCWNRPLPKRDEVIRLPPAFGGSVLTGLGRLWSGVCGLCEAVLLATAWLGPPHDSARLAADAVSNLCSFCTAITHVFDSAIHERLGVHGTISADAETVFVHFVWCRLAGLPATLALPNHKSTFTQRWTKWFLYFHLQYCI